MVPARVGSLRNLENFGDSKGQLFDAIRNRHSSIIESKDEKN